MKRFIYKAGDTNTDASRSGGWTVTSEGLKVVLTVISISIVLGTVVVNIAPQTTDGKLSIMETKLNAKIEAQAADMNSMKEARAVMIAEINRRFDDQSNAISEIKKTVDKNTDQSRMIENKLDQLFYFMTGGKFVNGR